MTKAETVGVVLGAVSIVMLLVVLYLLQGVYVVVRRDQFPKEIVSGASKPPSLKK
jgi:hypothetical protein